MEIIIKIVFLFFISMSSYADECTKEKAISAEQTVLSISNWDELHKHYKQYSICDDGSIAEGYSEVMSILLSEQWNGLKSIELDEDFKHFVIRHIDKSWDDSKYNIVNESAKNHCSKNINDICQAIISLTNSL